MGFEDDFEAEELVFYVVFHDAEMKIGVLFGGQIVNIRKLAPKPLNNTPNQITPQDSNQAPSLADPPEKLKQVLKIIFNFLNNGQVSRELRILIIEFGLAHQGFRGARYAGMGVRAAFGGRWG